MIFGNTDDSEKNSYKTLFGFETENIVAARSLNIVYGIVMVVSIAFAHYALGLILIDWPFIIVFLSALAVVGLPYCIKIILYGRKIFTLQMAVLCIAVSVLPTIFDFIGFYAKTSVRQSLIETKFEVLEKINYFDKEARQEINSNLLELDQEYASVIAAIDRETQEERKAIAMEINRAEQLYIDETQGVPGKITSGRPGEGPRAKELESEIRRKQAEAQIIEKSLEEKKTREIDKTQKDFDARKENLLEAVKTIDQLVTTKNNDGLVFQISQAQTFDELANGLIKLNTAVNIISSKLELKPEYVKFSTENIIQLSFGALFRGEITALICMTLAILLEIVDTVIVYMIRGERKPKKHKNEQPERNIRETTKYTL
jgi:hypothetical protein